jgi:hypothetical protein
MGVLLASPAPALQFVLRRLIGYRWALTVFEAGLIMLMVIIIRFGPETKNRDFLNTAEKNT